MQNQIQVFENNEFGKLEMLTIDGKPYFPAAECAETLGYKKPHDAVSRHCAYSVKHRVVCQTTNQHGITSNQEVEKIYIHEGDLYRLIIRSKLPSAVKFETWICDEILPSIRKYGGYITGDTLERLLSDPELAVKYFSMLKTEREKKEALEDRIEVLAPKVRYYDLILQCDTPIPVSVISKDYGMTAIVFNKLLHSFEVQYNIGGTWLLYKNHAGKGYTITKTYHVRGKTSAIHTCWTQKGRQFIYELLKWHGILPQVEREEADKCRT